LTPPSTQATVIPLQVRGERIDVALHPGKSLRDERLLGLAILDLEEQLALREQQPRVLHVAVWAGHARDEAREVRFVFTHEQALVAHLMRHRLRPGPRGRLVVDVGLAGEAEVDPARAHAAHERREQGHLHGRVPARSELGESKMPGALRVARFDRDLQRGQGGALARMTEVVGAELARVGSVRELDQLRRQTLDFGCAGVFGRAARPCERRPAHAVDQSRPLVGDAPHAVEDGAGAGSHDQQDQREGPGSVAPSAAAARARGGGAGGSHERPSDQ
jgi:hypothetical protein